MSAILRHLNDHAGYGLAAIAAGFAIFCAALLASALLGGMG